MTTATKDEPKTAPADAGEQGLAQTTAQSPATQQAPALARVPIRMGLAPQTLEEAWRMSQFMGQSEIVPKIYRGKPADILVAIQYGMELGFPPMQALQSIAVINGRPSVWGDGFLALIVASPLYRDHDEYYEVDGARRDTITVDDLKKDSTAAICTFWRQGKQLPVTRRFSVGQAKKAQLLGKEGPWGTYPDRMMLMRARGFAGRDAFPDLLRGIRTAEEALDMPSTDTIDLPASPQPLQPRRASEARAAASPPPQDSGPASSPSTAGDPSAAPATMPVAATRIAGLQIINTCFVRPKGVEPYYEVTATATATGEEQKFVTRDERLYKEAASFEGTKYLVAVDCHADPSTGVKVLMLDSIAAGDGGGSLFTE